MKSLPFKLLALAAMLAIQVPAVAQTNGGTAAPAPGTSKQAEYDCSGMTWTARDNCEHGAQQRSVSDHDCSIIRI